MFGWGYVIEYCISLFKKEQEEKIYKNYVAECARIVTENTAKIASLLSRGETEIHYMSMSFHDIIDPKPVEKRTSEEVIESIGNKLQQIGGENT